MTQQTNGPMNGTAIPEVWHPEVRFTPSVSLPEGILPSAVAEWIDALADADGLDRNALTMIFLVIAASSIPSDLRVYLHTDCRRTRWTEPALLWVLLVTQSGGGKTPNISPLMDLLKSVYRAFNSDLMTEFEADQERARLAGQEFEGEPPPYVSPVIEDITPASVVMKLESNEDTRTPLLLADDDASGFLGGFGRFGPGTESVDQAFYTKSYDGKEYHFNRKTGGEGGGPQSCVVNLHISMILGIQTRKLREYPNLADVGMFQRQMMVPVASKKVRNLDAELKDSQPVLDILKRLRGLSGSHKVAMTKGALGVHMALDAEQIGEDDIGRPWDSFAPGYQEWRTKRPSLHARLCLVIEAMKHAVDEDASPVVPDISEASAHQALSIVRYLETTSYCVYDELVFGELGALIKRIYDHTGKWDAGRPGMTFTRSDLQSKLGGLKTHGGIRGMANHRVQVVIDILLHHGWLLKDKGKSYRVNSDMRREMGSRFANAAELHALQAEAIRAEIQMRKDQSRLR